MRSIVVAAFPKGYDTQLFSMHTHVRSHSYAFLFLLGSGGTTFLMRCMDNGAFQADKAISLFRTFILPLGGQRSIANEFSRVALTYVAAVSRDIPEFL